MKEDKNYVSIYINDTIDILGCKYKKELTLRYLSMLQDLLGEDYKVTITSINHREYSKNCIREIFKAKGYEHLDIGIIKTNVNGLMQSRLKDRQQDETKHYLVFFSGAQDELLVNENNFSYYYNIDSILSGSYLNNLFNKIGESEWH